ncbi:MAG: GTP cyclohydrolase I FolE [Brevinematales bacterium]|jgi:GTP cyclohydrolase I
MDTKKVERLVTELLIEIGEDPARQGLLKTPQRFAESMQYLSSGYSMDVKTVLHDAIFDQETNNMIIIRDIEIYSLCEHHLLPFFGRCHIGYLALDKVLGASKLARIVDVFARRLQIQERLTDQIANAIHDSIETDGVGVVIEAKHLCMMMRGVEKQNSNMITSSVLGAFRSSHTTRSEFLSLIYQNEKW